MQETKIFLITFIAAFLGVLPPGLVNMTVAKTCVETGKKNGLYVALGASVIIFFQALLAILLTAYIFNNPVVKNILLRVGLVVFVILMIYFYVKARKDTHVEAHSKRANPNGIFKGMLIAALNVFPIPFFFSIAAALNVGGENEFQWVVTILFAVAATLGSFASLYLYIVFFDKIEDKTDRFTRYSNYFMAGLMLVLVIITVIRIFYVQDDF